MGSLVTLKNAVWELSLVPQYGASIVSCESFGFPIFEPARPEFETKQDVFSSSCFPLMPYSNRVDNGRFSYGGKMRQIKPNHPNQEYPIHGNAWERPWDVISQTDMSCRLCLVYKPEPQGWPWAYRAEQVISLKGDRLTFDLSIENSGDEPCPAGIGLHPFFAHSSSAQIEFQAQTVWECDRKLIPTKAKSTSAETGFSILQPIAGRGLDNCFSGWNGKARIFWPAFDRYIEIQADSIFSNIVVYIQPENSFFCLEPVSHINNALNLGGLGDMAVLNPGERLSGTVSFLSQRQPLR